ncbi:MAG: glycosyltransferase family 2 protein [Patescibacteria group bacterium]
MDISIITIAYKNSPEVLRACFESVAKSEGVSWEFIVVDNAGDAQTITQVSSVIPRATCIINNENKGFAAATNQALNIAKGRYVLMLNPDTSFAPNVLASMVAHMDVSPDVGVGSSVIRYPDGKLQESIRRFPTLKDQLCILLKIPHMLRRNNLLDSYMMRDKDPLATQDVDSIMGAFMWIRREVIDSVGLFDERYFIWFEEVDYCKMVVDAGWKVRHFADVEIVHHKGVSFSTVGFLRRQKWIRRSMRKYFWKHEGFLSWFVLFALAPVFIVLSYVGVLALAGKRKARNSR